MGNSRILNLGIKLSYVISGAVVFSLWLIALFHISSLWKGDSDSAFQAIAGLDPYFQFNTYLYALFVKIFGFRPALIHIVTLFIFLILMAFP